jgi:hypothetical protein
MSEFFPRDGRSWLLAGRIRAWGSSGIKGAEELCGSCCMGIRIQDNPFSSSYATFMATDRMPQDDYAPNSTNTKIVIKNDFASTIGLYLLTRKEALI